MRSPGEDQETMANDEPNASEIERLLARPPAAGFTNSLITCIVLPQVALILCMLWWWKHGGAPAHGVLSIFPGLMPPAMVLVGFSVWRLRNARLRRRLRLARGCVCVRCAYVLDRLGASGTCPECGLPFDRERTIRAWIDCRLHKPDARKGPGEQ